MSMSESRYQAVLAQIAADLVAEIQHGEGFTAVAAMGDDAAIYVDELLDWAVLPWRDPQSPSRGVAALILANRDLLRDAAVRAA